MKVKKYINDALSVKDITPFLSDNTIAGKIKVYDSLESTNKTAKESALSGTSKECGATIIIAQHQTAGRGRLNRSFHSPPESGIYMSFVLCCRSDGGATPFSRTPSLITAYAAVAVCQAIEATTKKTPQIKWVNDVFLGTEKICGILTEAVTNSSNNTIQQVIVGIGVNFTMPESGFPKEISNTAGALFTKEQPTTTKNRLAAEIINRMLHAENGFNNETLLCEYKKRLMMLNKRITVSDVKETYEATAIDVDGTGQLIVKKDNGETLSLCYGDISVTTLQ